MTRIGKSELVYGDVAGVDELLARVDRVTRADVIEVAERPAGRSRAASRSSGRSTRPTSPDRSDRHDTDAEESST